MAIVDFDNAIESTPEGIPGIPKEMEIDELSAMFDVITDFMSTQPYADLPAAYAYRSIAHFYKGDKTRAYDDLNKALELGLDPNYGQELEAWFSIDAIEPEIGPWEGELYQGDYQGYTWSA